MARESISDWNQLSLGQRVDRAAWMAVREHLAAEEREPDNEATAFAVQLDEEDFGHDQAAGLRRMVALFHLEEARKRGQIEATSAGEGESL